MRPGHDDIHVREMVPLVSPRTLKEELPVTPRITEGVDSARDVVQRILRKEDPRLLVVVGPCSIHDPDAAFEYAERLNEVRLKYQERLFLVMRTYFEKPRTTIGWRGLINDPHLDGSFDMVTGLRRARALMLKITEMGLPVGTEMLDPVTPQYFADLISWAAIGARTTESQTHRALASGLSMPVGFKNSTDGGLQIATDAIVSARHTHSFLGVDEGGQCCVVKTTGNPDAHLILRGGRSGPNYDRSSVEGAAAQMQAAGLDPAILIDCSHANSAYDERQQEVVWENVIRQRTDGDSAVAGMMVESNLMGGKQSISRDLSALRYGVSVTDACVDWETTERMLCYADTQLREVQGAALLVG